MDKDKILHAIPKWADKMQTINRIKDFCINVPEEDIDGYCCIALFTSNICNMLKNIARNDEVYITDILSTKDALKKIEKIEADLFKEIKNVLEVNK